MTLLSDKQPFKEPFSSQFYNSASQQRHFEIECHINAMLINKRIVLKLIMLLSAAVNILGFREK